MRAGGKSVLDAAGLRRRLLLFFIALSIPTVMLIWQAFSELKWEAFHRHRLLAEELATRIDRYYAKLLETEGARPFTDFSFLNVVGDDAANLLQRSTLAAFPPSSPIPGVIGYFQIDAEGRFTTPYLPLDEESAPRYGVSSDELRQRIELTLKIRRILSENRLVAPKPLPRPVAADERQIASITANRESGRQDKVSRYDSDKSEQPHAAPQTQAAFDRLQSLAKSAPKRRLSAASSAVMGRLEDLKLAQPFAEKRLDEPRAQAPGPVVDEPKKMRKEHNVLPAPELGDRPAAPPQSPSQLPVLAFVSELDPYQFSQLDDGRFVLFRNVWRDSQRYIQGVLIESQPFLREGTGDRFEATLLASTSDLLLAYRGNVLVQFGNKGGDDYFSHNAMQGSLLYRTALSAPLDGIDLVFTVTRLPPGAGSSVIVWSSAVLLLVLCAGFLMIYRLGLRQIDLNHQQLEFVSAVSHELKTPLTSIRMYGEMLMKGWVAGDKRQTYYRYIFDEGERLSRLIENVLHFARMNRHRHSLELSICSTGEMIDGVRSKLLSQTEAAGYSLKIACEDKARGALIRIDRDALTQVLINLVDNALKFSAAAAKKEVEIGCRLEGDARLCLWVRDFGMGVPRDQRSKIFEMFYRSEDEMTRETQGTGIGLALVHRLVTAMQGSVAVINRKPGAEFQLRFPQQR